MMRWGYDAWAFDWEQETPLFGEPVLGRAEQPRRGRELRPAEFIRFCKQQDIVPFRHDTH